MENSFKATGKIKTKTVSISLFKGKNMKRFVSIAALLTVFVMAASVHAQGAACAISGGTFEHKAGNVYDVSVSCAMASSQTGTHTITLFEMVKVHFPGNPPMFVRFRTILIKTTGQTYSGDLAGTIEYSSDPGGITVVADVKKNGIEIGSSNELDID